MAAEQQQISRAAATTPRIIQAVPRRAAPVPAGTSARGASSSSLTAAVYARVAGPDSGTDGGARRGRSGPAVPVLQGE